MRRRLYSRGDELRLVREALDIYEERRETEGLAAIDSTLDTIDALLDQIVDHDREIGSEWTWSRHIYGDGKRGCYRRVYHAADVPPPRTCPHCKRALYHVDQEAVPCR